ncbi:hypothetical protein [Neptuniibacter sp.]|uniref:hypothetical protein n=1 Tax=Neptuniibacter sp. TaxID=1962643 RepID=UPI0026113171|nr:hypothetical protein [Neptuniibacter sp.]MCP4596237.1 hypothetical protein [Neptuniibacter sp.]
MNGRPGCLADVSEETLIGMRNKSQPTVVPIKHGDYGYLGTPSERRVFVRVVNVVASFDVGGTLMRPDANRYNRRHSGTPYIITGNVFEDMQNLHANLENLWGW